MPEPEAPPPPAAEPAAEQAPTIQAPAAHAAPVQEMPEAATLQPPATRKRPVRWIITVTLLSLLLVGAIVALVLYALQLADANDRISEQKKQLDEQEKLIDEKETFGAAMQELLDTASQLDGTLFATIVPTSSYELTARREWTHRWDAADIADDVDRVKGYTSDLEELIDTAATEASTNTTGSVYETTIDSLGGGFVSSLLYDADTFCESDVLACVDPADPYTVHFDLADNNVEYTNDFIRQGVAYHEFAHVLQITNPEPTEVALDSFGGDDETMADCFALTYLPGWKLDHRIWVSSYMYWDVSIGYGYTCNDAQKQVVRDWYSQLGYTTQPISQER